MSLRVWLPLDGDLRNLGVSNTEVTNSGATVDSAGKIGKCYYFDGSSSNYIATTYSTAIGINDFSIAMWIKIPTLTSGTYYAICTSKTTAGASAGFGIYWNYSRKKFLWSTADGSAATEIWMANTVDDIVYDKWIHLVMIRNSSDARKGYFYINGIRYELASIPVIRNITTDTKMNLGRCTNNNYFAKMYLNDFRIYDHALSPLEVKEIAQGLVLHYKLDASSEEKITIIPSTNAYSYPTFNTSTTSGGWNHWGPSGHSGSYGQNTDKKYIYNKNNTYSHWITEDAGTGKYYLLYQSPAFEGGYRSLQAIIKEENSLPITESICYPGWNARNGGVPNNKWTSIKFLGDGFYYCCCEGVSQDGSNDLIGIDVKPGYKIYVSECYLENNTETCSPIFTYSSNIVQDSSGYNHNGIITGDLMLVSESQKYSIATKWNCSDPTTNNNTGLCYIQTPLSLTTPSQLTFAWWAKPESGYGDSTSHAAFCTSNNATEPTDYNRTAFHHRDGSFDIYPSDASGGKRLSFTYTQNEWHHYAVTYDGTTARAYQDGVLKTNVTVGTNKTLASFSQLYIGFSKAGGVWRKTLGSYSDFRVYVTQLLDTDIKQLYNVGMKVDKTQNIHNFELVEKGYNILAATPWCSSYSTHNPITSPFTNFNANGEVQFTANGSSAGTNYLEITPGVYEYDYTISVNTGNQFYIGFERYDANKTSRSNNACVYTYSTKPSTDVIKQRYKGTVNLSTDGTNPLKYMALRILNGWSGTTSGVTGQATIHNFSLRLQSAAINPKIIKAGQLIGDEFKEYSSAKFYKDHIIEANQFIER